MTTLEILTKARALIEDPRRWIQNTDARDPRGVRVDPTSTHAECFCATLFGGQV